MFSDVSASQHGRQDKASGYQNDSAKKIGGKLAVGMQLLTWFQAERSSCICWWGIS